MLRVALHTLIILLSLPSAWAAPDTATLPSPTPSTSPAPPPTPSGEETKPTPWTAQLRIKKTALNKEIAGLTFAESEVPISLRPQGDKLRPLIAVHGHFRRPGWALYAGKVLLVPAGPADANRADFSLYLYLKDRYDTATFTARGPKGETETEQIIVLSPDAQEFSIRPGWGELVFSIGATSFYYYQTQYGNFSSHTGLLQLAYTTPDWRSNFGLLAKVQTTLLTFSSSPSGLGPQLIEGKLDGSYKLRPLLKKKLELKALLGVSYLSMLSNGSPFGFANLLAGEAGVSATYSLGPRSGLIGDFRYIPLSGIISFSQCGVDMDFGWTRTLQNRHRVEIGLGYFGYAYQPNTTTVVRASTLSLRLGYSI
ncbi:MAG: hypothetical protein P4M08_12740 [Oligoflexia bacterium]|nr:hypothetical protein [Oligoflexia bacterium]